MCSVTAQSHITFASLSKLYHMLPNLYIQSDIKSLTFLKKTDNIIIYVGPELSAADKSLLTATGAPVVFVQDIYNSILDESEYV